MSICQGVTHCFVDTITHEATSNILFLRASYAVSAVTGTIPLIASFYSIGEGNNFFIATAILCEAFALISALSPICFGQFISQIQLLQEGPLCSPVLGERKMRQNLAWAVKELTPIKDLQEKFREHFVTNLHTQGVFRIIVAISAIFTLYLMKKQRISFREDKLLIYVFTAMAFDFGLVCVLINPTFDTRFKSLFDSCLKSK